VGFIVLGIANKLDAACFGISVTSGRLSKGHLTISRFSPFGAINAWQLNDEKGPEEPLAHHIKIQCLTQYGAELLKYVLDQGDLLSLEESSYFSNQAKTMIVNDLRGGNYPFILMLNGSEGHLVVAYDLEESDETDISFYIYIYDPNEPFRFTENSDPELHLEREKTRGRIPVYRNGRFNSPQGLGWESMEVHGHLLVLPYDSIPFNPIFPASPEGVLTLVTGSANIEQITDATGRTLFDSNGSINMDAATRLVSKIAYWVPVNSINKSKKSNGFLIGDNKFYRWTVKGINTGKYSNFVLSENMAGR
jgi:hypothetical protein